MLNQILLNLTTQQKYNDECDNNFRIVLEGFRVNPSDEENNQEMQELVLDFDDCLSDLLITKNKLLIYTGGDLLNLTDSLIIDFAIKKIRLQINLCKLEIHLKHKNDLAPKVLNEIIEYLNIYPNHSVFLYLKYILGKVCEEKKLILDEAQRVTILDLVSAKEHLINANYSISDEYKDAINERLFFHHRNKFSNNEESYQLLPQSWQKAVDFYLELSDVLAAKYKAPAARCYLQLYEWQNAIDLFEKCTDLSENEKDEYVMCFARLGLRDKFILKHAEVFPQARVKIGNQDWAQDILHKLWAKDFDGIIVDYVNHFEKRQLVLTIANEFIRCGLAYLALANIPAATAIYEKVGFLISTSHPKDYSNYNSLFSNFYMFEFLLKNNISKNLALYQTEFFQNLGIEIPRQDEDTLQGTINTILVLCPEQITHSQLLELQVLNKKIACYLNEIKKPSQYTCDLKSRLDKMIGLKSSLPFLWRTAIWQNNLMNNGKDQDLSFTPDITFKYR